MCFFDNHKLKIKGGSISDPIFGGVAIVDLLMYVTKIRRRRNLIDIRLENKKTKPLGTRALPGKFLGI